MSRIPIRVRLALAFASVMALVLAATGVFLYDRLAAELDQTIDRELNARLAGAVTVVADDGDDLGDPDDDPLERLDRDGAVQVLDGDGDVAGALPPSLARTRPLNDRELRLLLSGQEAWLDRRVTQDDQPLRFKAATTTDDGERYTVLVGASFEQRDATLSRLRTLLLIGGPIALLLATLAGFGVAVGALRPVEAMRRRAAAISAGQPGQRLPVPPTRDEIAGLGTTLNAMLDRLERALARERELVADAGHELRTPLAILRAELELALRRGGSREDLEAAVVSGMDETDRLARLADDLLALAAADAQRLRVNPVETDAGGLLATVRDRVAARADGRPVSVEAAPDVTVRVDRARVEQALTNLVDNALSYGAGPVELAARQRDGVVELHVRDRGDGFPQGFAERAFERFTRADAARSGGGAGLGLAIAEGIARAHGGTAHAANRPGGGADVWLSLPAADSEGADREG